MSTESTQALAAARTRFWIRYAVAALVLSATAFATGRASADKGPGPVTLAEVTTPADTAGLADLTGLVRRDAEAAIAAIDWSKQRLRKRYTVSASVVRLESTPLGERSLQASCTVSTGVRDERGTLLAIVEGRARTEGSRPSAATDALRDAVAGAVEGAIQAVPEAIRRAQ